MQKTLKVRVKDKHCAQLRHMAKAVNFCWNYINDLSHRSIKERKKFLSAYAIHTYTTGASKELGLHSQTPQCIAKEYVTRRRQFKRSRLNWRKSGGTRRSLGWVPINTGAAKWKNGQIYHNGHYYKVWDSYGLSDYRFKSASFNEDARGRWYFTGLVGIDLGCKDAVTCSDRTKYTGRLYRQHEKALTTAQRARKKQRVKAIHAKIKNTRNDDLQKLSTRLVRQNGAIFVGNISSTGLAKTKMAKSVLDAGWGLFKTMLEYKCAHAGVVFEVVNEAYTTQTCSRCRIIPDSSPKGRADLGIRQWTCSGCGAIHERDFNASDNIAEAGRCLLAGGTHV